MPLLVRPKRPTGIGCGVTRSKLAHSLSLITSVLLTFLWISSVIYSGAFAPTQMRQLRKSYTCAPWSLLICTHNSVRWISWGSLPLPEDWVWKAEHGFSRDWEWLWEIVRKSMLRVWRNGVAFGRWGPWKCTFLKLGLFQTSSLPFIWSPKPSLLITYSLLFGPLISRRSIIPVSWKKAFVSLGASSLNCRFLWVKQVGLLIEWDLLLEGYWLEYVRVFEVWTSFHYLSVLYRLVAWIRE